MQSAALVDDRELELLRQHRPPGQPSAEFSFRGKPAEGVIVRDHQNLAPVDQRPEFRECPQ